MTRSRRERLPKSLFGLDEAEVDRALHEQEAANEEQVRMLREALAVERARRDRVVLHVGQLENELATQAAVASELEDAVAGSDRTAALVREALAKHVQALEEEAAAKEQSQQTRIGALTEEVQLALSQLEATAEQLGIVPGDVAAPVTQPEGMISRQEAPRAEAKQLPVQTAPATRHRVLPFRTAQAADSERRGAAPIGAGPAVPIQQPAPDSAAPVFTTAPNPAEPAPEDASQVEAGLRARIETDMMRMLTGKVAGAELRDAGGNLIASRGAPITRDLAAAAEAAGLLPDLILHMAWPEEVQT